MKVDLIDIKANKTVTLEREVAVKILNRTDSKGRWELPEDSKWEIKGNELINRGNKKVNKEAKEQSLDSSSD